MYMNLLENIKQLDTIQIIWISFIIEVVIMLFLCIPIINWHLTKNDEKLAYLYNARTKKAEKRLIRFLHRNLY